MSDRPVALIVEDDYTAADVMARQFEKAGFAVSVGYTAEEGYRLAEETMPMLVVIDERLPDASGVELLSSLRPNLPDATFVVATVVDDEGLMTRAFDMGCNYYVLKPNGLKKLYEACSNPEQLLNPNAKELFRGR
jgi:DNA-binding response OmpR family regulator